MRRAGIKGAGIVPVSMMGAVHWTYARKVLAYDPIAYWIQGEAAGAVSFDEVTDPDHLGINQSGAYTGVTLRQPGIGDGNTCPLFDGANDINNVFSASLAAAFSGNVGSMMIWARVSGVGVWADGVERRFVQFQRDGNNFIIFRKNVGLNTLQFLYRGSGAATQDQGVITNTTDWFHIAMTWNQVANQVIYYFGGAQQGGIDPCAGWADAAVSASIGAVAGPALVWDGTLAHPAVWDYVLSPAAIADLAVIP
jgi:hypothetical protein